MTEPRRSAWRAELADGRAPVMRDVSVGMSSEAIDIRDAVTGELCSRWPLARMSLDELQEGVAHASCRDQPLAVLTITDASLATALRARVGQRTRLPGTGRRRRFAAACAAGILILGSGAYLLIPLLSTWVAERVPIEYERELGTRVLPLIRLQYCDHPAAAAALAALKRRLDPYGEVQAELHVLRSDQLNAFALPGGVVVITEELLLRASGPDEVAGVLAHELEHVRERHVLRHFVRATLLAAGWSVAVGDYAGLMVVDPATAFNVINLRFSREEEAAADAGAALALDRAGVSRRGLYDFFQRLRADTDSLPAWLSNHPTSESRALVLGAGTAAGALESPALDAEAFAALQGACSLQTARGGGM
jgi:Zn-dependent protease with chaperone function